MPDFSNLLSQAKKMQEKMKETQEMLKKIEVEGVSGGNAVKIIMNGDGELKNINFSENVFKIDIYSLVKTFEFLVIDYKMK